MSPEGQAYQKMSHFYRPKAPSDGMGTITVPMQELDLDAEIAAYEHTWESEDGVMDIGCADYSDREALVWIVEAARMLCGMEHKCAKRLLMMAILDIDSRMQ